MATSSPSFGKYLATKGLISPEQLDEATQALVVFGGRLGTNLIELGYLRIDQVEQYLADHLQVPAAPEEWLMSPAPAALEALPTQMAERYRVLPLRIDERGLHLAMTDPHDPHQLEDLGFATGLQIQPYVFSEVHASFFLEKHLQIPREIRYINLGPTAARGRLAGSAEDSAPDHGATGGSPPPAAFDRESARELFDSGVLDLAPPVEAVWGGSAASGRGNGSALPPVGAAEAPQGPEVAEAEVSEAVRVEEPPEALEPERAYAFEEAQEVEPQAAAPPAPEAEEPGAAEAREPEEPETEDAQEAAAAPAVADPAPEPRKPEAAPELESAAGPPPATAADLAALEAAMVSAPDREALSRLALRIARLYACAAATFTVRGGMIHGVLAVSDAGERQVDGILVPCGVDCILSGPATWGEPFRGNPPRTGLDGSLLAALGRSSAREVAIFPIQIGEKVVNLLYVDNGPNPLGETACAALATLCNCVAGAYEQLIVAIRSQHC